MWRDVERLASGLNLPFRRPDPFPQNSVLPARVALVGLAQGWGEDFSVAVYAAQRLGVFGAPSFTTADGELFWGNDRLEQALAWAKRGG